ncbi:MAG TPA: alpha/beta hydrolase [Nitrososphaeraceae archaeon]|nr:alpha/beta hydrolase [Nitrososphaeraceae archaeon]
MVKNLIILFVVLSLIMSMVISSIPIAIPSVYSSSSDATGLNSSSIETSTEPVNVDPKKIRVGDINITYKIFGKGDPLLFIPGFSMTMDMWEPMLNGLPENHTIVLFDNRGVGKTTTGNESIKNTTFTINQFTNDTAALIDALKIRQPVDILGLSLGGYIAQELALSHPEMVNRLILVASSCGGNQTIPPQISPQDFKSMVSGNATKELFLHTLFPQDWIQNNTEYIENEFIFPMGKSPSENLQLQSAAAGRWSGTCERVADISAPTIVVTGTQDITSPPPNSIRLADKIPGAWLVQIEGGGHGLMFQYPEKFARIVETFLGVTA